MRHHPTLTRSLPARVVLVALFVVATILGVRLYATHAQQAPTNLALGKPATQISTAAGAPGATANRAVDGNRDGNFFDGSVTHTEYEVQPWWQVDLGASYNLGYVTLWNRTDCACPERLTNFYVLVSDQPFASTNLSASLSQLGVSAYYTPSGAGPVISLAVPRTGRYIRVQLADTNFLSLAEVEVYAPPSTAEDDPGDTPFDDATDMSDALTNVALSANGSTAVASSTYSGPGLYGPASAIDGDRTGVNWANNGGWNDGTQANYPDWLRVNFPSKKILSEIDVFTLRDNFQSGFQPTLDEIFTRSGITDFRVQYLLPDVAPEQWIDVPNGSVTGNQNIWRKFTLPSITTSAIRVYVTATKQPAPGSYSRIVEVEAWGTDALQSIFLSSGGASDCAQNNSAHPCALDLDLMRVINGQQTISNWTTKLDWNYMNWNGTPKQNPNVPSYGSQNLPVLAHAIALWKGVAGSTTWWSTFLSCQTGDGCPYLNPTQYPLQRVWAFKGTELFSNIYDYHAVAAVIAVRQWAVNRLMVNPSDSTAYDIGNKARRYLRLNWALYALAAGDRSVTRRIDRYSASPQVCQQKSGQDTYSGYFVALAGMRSTYRTIDLCEDDRGALLTEAIDVSYFANWPSTTLDLVHTIESKPQGNFFDKDENAYALTPAQRTLLQTQILSGTQAKGLTDFLVTVRLSTPYHIISWADPSTGVRSIVTMLEKNYDHATSAVYAYKYTEANRTVQILFPWSNRPATAHCGNPLEAPYRQQIGSGYAKFLPTGSTTPTSIEASNFDPYDRTDTPSCVHEDGKPIKDSMTIPTTGLQYHIVLGPNQAPTCTIAGGAACQ
jgi:hypothetical protein